ncbi:MAG: HAD family hydrolase [Mangrovibacterium sp.]
MGDSGIDMQTANNTGMYAAGMLWGFRSKEELLLNGACVAVGHASGLISLL